MLEDITMCVTQLIQGIGITCCNWEWKARYETENKKHLSSLLKVLMDSALRMSGRLFQAVWDVSKIRQLWRSTDGALPTQRSISSRSIDGAPETALHWRLDGALLTWTPLGRIKSRHAKFFSDSVYQKSSQSVDFGLDYSNYSNYTKQTLWDTV